MKTIKKIVVALFAWSAIAPTIAQENQCAVFVRDAFNTSTKALNAKSSSQFKAWQCSTKFSTHKEAMNAGVDLDTEIYGVPVKLDGKFGKNIVDKWKQDNCSDKETASDYAYRTYEVIRTFAPESEAIATKCLEVIYGTKALACSIVGSGENPVFTAAWRRTDGELDSAIPVVTMFSVKGGNCSPGFTAGDKVFEGGKPTICAVDENSELIVALGTSRGSCFKGNTKNLLTEIISGKIVLDANKTIQSERVEIKNDAFLVTNGYQLSIVGTKEIQISGNPRIVSFTETDSVKDRGLHGRPGGTVMIQTPRLSGNQLTVQNFGEDGKKGATGATGPRGSRGSGNVWKCEGLSCGCKGAVDGGTGFQGLPGGQGGYGGPAGPVVLNIGAGLKAGELNRIIITSSRKMKDGMPRACRGSCGGTGGEGGDGGEGGTGGLGGSGLGGCGGSGSGGPGPKGPTGQGGMNGNDLQPTIL